MIVEKKEKPVRKRLKELFGYSHFKGKQETIIKNILSGKNTFVIMPTGGGKSLCYQLPALMQEGMAIVISPLIALMKNQVDQLNSYGINACFLNSSLNKSEIKRIKKACYDKEVKLLYMAPESLNKEEYILFLQEINISFVAVDEAHCISGWGHDFRPEYRKIKSMIEQLGNMPVIALTATATPKVQIDIQKNLKMEKANIFLSSFNRENLYYEIQCKENPEKQLIRFLKENTNKSGIIYCLSRKKVEEIAKLVVVNGFKAAPYHAGLDPSVRVKNQDDFLTENIKIIVATIAFGMGIDKPDVRFVVHYDVPKSLEGYYQETGRAGRDGLEGKCLMLYSPEDLIKMEKFNKDKSVQERENARALLDEMKFFAESPLCRRKQILHYFGEDFQEENCGLCDNCENPGEKYDGSKYITLILEAVQQTKERFDMNHLISILCGIENEYTKSYDHIKLPIYGKGKANNATFWKSAIRQTLIYNYLKRDINEFGILKITEKGKKFLIEPHSINLIKDRELIMGNKQATDKRPDFNIKGYDDTLFEMLRLLRKQVAKKKELPPYVIFQDSSLEEMATTYPTTSSQLASINGVGTGKVQKFGEPFLNLIYSYVEENDIEVASDIVMKSSINKSKTKIFIIHQIDRKVDLLEIAKAKSISFNALLNEIENICYSGTKLNLNYYIDSTIDDSKQQYIYECLLNSETDSIEDILDSVDSYDISEDEVRIIRIKFLSEYAN